MPIPSSITNLDTNPNNNSPQGSENVGPNANGYIQALGAFIRQIYNGAQNPTAAVPMNGQKLTNLGAGSTTSSSSDAITGGQARALAYKIGEVRMWHGTIANIATVWGPGWQLADGTNGTADLRDRFIVGAGINYMPGYTGGTASNWLSVGQLPAHNHGVNDPGHAHGVYDPGHNHVLHDPQHQHTIAQQVPITGSGYPRGLTAGGGDVATYAIPGVNYASTGMWMDPAPTGIGIYNAGTGISTQNTGSGAAIENRPPYYSLCFIEYTGIGA